MGLGRWQSVDSFAEMVAISAASWAARFDSQESRGWLRLSGPLRSVDMASTLTSRSKTMAAR
jgi:hypothetical protein